MVIYYTLENNIFICRGASFRKWPPYIPVAVAKFANVRTIIRLTPAMLQAKTQKEATTCSIDYLKYCLRERLYCQRWLPISSTQSLERTTALTTLHKREIALTKRATALPAMVTLLHRRPMVQKTILFPVRTSLPTRATELLKRPALLPNSSVA